MKLSVLLSAPVLPDYYYYFVELSASSHLRWCCPQIWVWSPVNLK